MWQHQRLFNWLVGFEAQRKRALAQAPQGPLKEYLSIAAPSLNAKLTQLPIIAVDFETTGLNPLTDKILSVGTCTLKGHQI